MILRTLTQNGREVAQIEGARGYRFVSSRNGCKVKDAAPAFIRAVRKLQLFHTPTQSGQRAVYSVLLPVSSGVFSPSAGFGRVSARTTGSSRFGLLKIWKLSCLSHKKKHEQRGLLSCNTELGLPLSQRVSRWPRAARRRASRPLSVQAQARAPRSFLTPTPLQELPWGPVPTIFTARKIRANVSSLRDGARSERPAHPVFKTPKMTAARLLMRGGFACDIPLNKRDRRCSKRS